MSISNNFPSIRPSLNLDFANVKALDPRISFVRTTTATYYDGVTTAKAEENLLTYSQEFDVAFTDTSVTTTDNNSAAPDGTTTASLLQASGAAARVGLSRTITLTSGVDYAISFFAKAGTHDIIQVAGASGLFSGNGQAIFDLTNGVLGTVAGGTATITSVGNSWYRCTWVSTSSGTSGLLYLTLVDSTTATRFDSTGIVSGDNVELWGAQLEQRSAVTAYTPTTTQPITNYVPVLLTAASGVARFDHNPLTGESLGLLVEEQRTNLFTYSEEFDNAGWGKTNGTVVANTVVAPDGALTGDALIENTAAGNHQAAQSVSVTSGLTYVLSVYAKAASTRQLNFIVPSTHFTTTPQAIFNLQTGVVVSSASGTASIVPVGNGWYRCVLVTVAATSTGTNSFILRLHDGASNSYTGDGYSGIYIWGAQLESGNFSTSYVPTTSATVTRNADAASMTGTNFSSWYRADQGGLYSEYQTVDLGSGRFASIAAITDGTSNNRIQLTHNSAQRRYVVSVSGVTQADTSVANAQGADAVGVFAKFGAAYQVNDFAGVVNGASAVTDTSGTIPVVDRFIIGASAAGATGFTNGTIKKIAFYPARLSDAQLQALTTT